MGLKNNLAVNKLLEKKIEADTLARWQKVANNSESLPTKAKVTLKNSRDKFVANKAQMSFELGANSIEKVVEVINPIIQEEKVVNSFLNDDLKESFEEEYFEIASQERELIVEPSKLKESGYIFEAEESPQREGSSFELSREAVKRSFSNSEKGQSERDRVSAELPKIAQDLLRKAALVSIQKNKTPQQTFKSQVFQEKEISEKPRPAREAVAQPKISITRVENQSDSALSDKEELDQLLPFLGQPKKVEVKTSSYLTNYSTWQGQEVKSALSYGTLIEGNFSFDSPVRVDGKISGDISSTSALIVGEQGEIEGLVKVHTLIVLGEIRGEIEASESVQIEECGSIKGQIVTPSLRLEKGAKIKAKVFSPC